MKLKTHEEETFILHGFEYKSNAPSSFVMSSLAICDNYEQLGHRLLIDGYASFLICKN